MNKPNLVDVELFVASLAFPKLAAYVVNKLMVKYSCGRTEATALWDLVSPRTMLAKRCDLGK
jgi:hypothetical protein